MGPKKLQAALALHRAGRLAEAEQLYREMLRVDPDEADVWHLLGMVAHQRGDHAAGVGLIQRAIALCREFADYHNNLATAHYALGDYAAAEAACREAIRLRPSFSQAHNNLGNALLEQDRPGEALACYQEALRLDPGYLLAWTNSASALRKLGRLDEAASHYESALRIDPAAWPTLRHLGDTLRAMGRWEQSIACYERALALHPESTETLVRLAVCFRHVGRGDESAECLRRVVARDPGNARALNDLGESLWRAADTAEAAACFRRAIEIMPDLAPAHFNLANALREGRQLDEAEASYRRALAIETDSVAALTNLAITLSEQGRTEEARDCFLRARAAVPDDARAHSHMLVVQQYLPGATPAGLQAEHAEWNRRHAAGLATARPRRRVDGGSDRPLQLGLVSRDFRRHPVGFFLVGALEALDQRRFPVTCYADQAVCDEMTDRIRGACRRWRPVSHLTDAQLADLIREDNIDILVELAGHTAGHRLLTLARKPAPLQGTWMGYVGTTGLTAIDFLLSDRFHTPEGVDRDYVEQVIRLPDGYVCYSPPRDDPPVARPPHVASGSVTFGSFNNPAKLSHDALDLWAEILRRIPDARLLLKYDGLESRGAANHFLAQLGLRGIAAQRVALEGHSSHRGLLERYHAVDVALDTCPYSGGLTTCEALWMGVPVITLPGSTFASRHALSHLSNVGLTEFVAHDAPHYVDLAVQLAADATRRIQLRAEMRDRVACSPLCDGRRFAVGLEAALERVWRHTTESTPTAPATRSE